MNGLPDLEQAVEVLPEGVILVFIFFVEHLVKYTQELFVINLDCTCKGQGQQANQTHLTKILCLFFNFYGKIHIFYS